MHAHIDADASSIAGPPVALRDSVLAGVIPVLAAVAGAVSVALRTRSMALPIVAGVAVFMLAAALR